MPKAILHAAMLRLERASWRTVIVGKDRLDRLIEQGTHVMAGFWHGKYLPIFPLLEGVSAGIISTESRRGHAIAAISRRFGYHGILVPDHSPAEAAAAISRAMEHCDATATALDGPLGPRCRVKGTIIRLASRLNTAIIPVNWAARHTMTLDSRWDRMQIPLPFTRLALVVGDPVLIPAGVKGADVARYARTVESALADAEAAAHSLLERS